MHMHYIRLVSTAGVDIVEADATKGTLTVTGAADPYEVILRTKKTGKCVEVVSIGPPPAPPKPPEQNKPEEKKHPPEKKPPGNKPEEKKSEQKAQAQVQPQFQLQLQAQPQFQLQPQPQPQVHIPPPYMGQNFHPPYMGQSYPMCDRVAVVYVGRQYEPNPACTIM